MTAVEHGVEVNLAELRSQLTERLALMVIAFSGIAAWRALSWEPFPFVPFWLALALLGLGWSVYGLRKRHPVTAQHLMAWGLILGLVAAMAIFPPIWLPFLSLMFVFVAGMLVPRGEFTAAGVIAVAAMALNRLSGRDYPLTTLLVALALEIVLTWMIVYTLYSALAWAWTMQQRADQLLEEVREGQGKLKRTLKSLNLTNSLLSRAQRELLVARRQADAARVMKEQFAANVSHELRTPLNLILGFSELLYFSPGIYGEMQWSPKLRRAIYQIYRSSHHLLEMIDDVLNLSRFEQVGFTLNREPTPLAPLLQEAVEIAQDLFQGEAVTLQTEFAPDLPTLEIDRTRIRQVLLNLLNNAARFTEEGYVRVTARQTDDEVWIGVSDTGPGIPADELSRIFEEFYQVDRTLRRKHGGTGLGLAISKRFVEAHKGRIWVESQEGKGTTFTVALPLTSKNYLRAQHSPLDTTLLRTSLRAPLLVVEPDPAVPEMLRHYLEGYEIVQVGDPAQLMEQVVRHHPQAVICNMPLEQLSDTVRDALGMVTFIESALPSRKRVAESLSVAACLTKPVSAKQLLHEIEQLENVHEILVADYDRGFCQLVDQMLESSGQSFTVRHAYDGVEALQAMREHRPDMLLMDMALPEMDGLQVLAEMRQEQRLENIPVLLWTAGNYMEEALEHGGKRMMVWRGAGFSTMQVLQYLKAIVEVLKSNYADLSSLDEEFKALVTAAASPTARPDEAASGETPPRSENKPGPGY